MEKSKEKYIWLGKVPVGIGAIIRGWDILEKNFRNPNTLPVVDFRAMTEKCPHDCDFCFTDKNKKTLSLKEIKRVINEIAQMGARGINFLGEGEPTIDKDFFEIVEFTSSVGVIPVVFTDGATKLRNRSFVKRLKNSGASVVLKCDSLFDEKYQNEVVKDKTEEYFLQRNESMKVLVDEGFNEIKHDGTTRLGFDMVVTKRNIDSALPALQLCRQTNVYIIFTLYLPSGRVIQDGFDKSLSPSVNQIVKIKNEILKFDEWYKLKHLAFNNFLTTGCVERLQIYGDGRVSPCPGNEKIIGNVKDFSIKELNQILLSSIPRHNPCFFDGNCVYR